MKKISTATAIFAALFLVFAAPIGAATLQQQYDDAQRKLAEVAKKKQDAQSVVNQYKNQAAGYQNETNRLSAEIALLDAEINEKQASIDELNIGIQLLTDEMETSSAIISQTEYDIEQTQIEVDRKLKGMYMDYKTGLAVSEVDTSVDTTDMFKKLQYKTVLIEQTKVLIEELNKQKEQIEVEKKSLEEKSVKLQRDKQSIDEEKAVLDSKKADLNVQRQAFYKMQEEARRAGKAAQNTYAVLSDEEAEIRAKAQAIGQQLFANTSAVPNGSYVIAGTRIGYQGNTGISTGPHLHFSVSVNGVSTNPCSKLGSGPFGNCKGDGTLPVWPQKLTHYFTSSYGNRCYNHNGTQRCTFHDGIDLASPTANAPIFAAHDGWMSRGFDKCSGSLCNNGGANYVVICQNRTNCKQGIKTGYWHLSGF